MAGIGFELKKLYSRHGLFASFRATSYATAVCAGPMLLGIVLLLGIMFECNYFGRSAHDRELLVCMTTYSLLGSLVVTSFFSMVITRFLADMLFSDHPETVLPSFFGINAFTLVIGGTLEAIFLMFCGSPFHQCACVWCFFMELIVTWNAQSYLTAVKEYRGILISYLLAIGVSLTLAALALYFGMDTVVGTLLSLCLGYGTMLVYDFVLIFHRFPDSNLSPFMFTRWLDKFLVLAMIGLLITIGLFSHLVIIWVSPLQVIVEGLWMGAPFHDVPALLAFLTILITTVSFVVSIEVNFYPKYKEYYSLFNDRGTIRDILRVEKEMLTVLKQELQFTALKQLFCSAVCISLGELILTQLPLGFNDLMFGYFRTLTVGYGIYAVANTFVLLQLYFTDYNGAFRSVLVFAVSTSLFTILLLPFDVKFYGFGFLAGCALFFVFSLVRLDAYTKKLPYYVLAVQPMVSEDRRGRFTRVGVFLESRLDQKGMTNDDSQNQ